MPRKITRYQTPEEIVLRWANMDPEFPVTDLSDIGEVGGYDLDGEPAEACGPEDMVEGVREQQCWGFTDVKSGEIFVWFSDDCPGETLMEFLGHEIGHNSGTPEDDEAKEEQRANLFGDVAAEAYGLLMQLRGTTASQSLPA